ncbi:Methyl-accepting chemotaxis protein (MCP) signalling domain-containing protein [Cohnella sp. OV330]|uniref:methyl-accepting chemotaxis protein n=1 Tax=Cohnella sp. OV330 TaxID=1855288 RepID=UPI0008EEB9CC|nr:methyl-accepting chemotaxis protein [Cohnella sp. OV330]SFB03528.1 Methyl-accepting chemotaxis protein (MCP) signalling domain-containing protein [Cohnella sp. OV330]
MIRRIKAIWKLKEALRSERPGAAEDAEHNRARKLAILELLDSTEQIASYSDELAATTSESTRGMTAIQRSTEQIARGSAQIAAFSDECARSMEEMAEGITRIAEASAIVHEASIQSAAEAEGGSLSLDGVMMQMNAITESIDQSDTLIQSLGESSDSVRKIIGFISEIAAQTNLLSLNAAIEAARAGEHGRGFAVVAAEVKKLADQSSQAAIQITQILEDIRIKNEQSMQAMSAVRVEVRWGVQKVEETSDVFHRIVSGARQVAEQIHDVSAVAEQLSASSEEIAASVAEMNHISQATASNVEAVLNATEEQLGSIEEIAALGEQLNLFNQDLGDRMSKVLE